MKKKQNIVILGAGVSGLSTGILLLQQGYHVSIWAKDLPPHTTSNKAAAFWYPYLCNPKDKATRWAKITLEYIYKEIMPDTASGCIVRTITEVLDKKSGEPWWRAAVPAYRRPDVTELPVGYEDGFQVEGVLMDTSIYMDYLVKKYQQLGGTIQQRTITTFDEPLQSYDIVVNCTAMGSRQLCNDSKVYPIRGQMVKIKPNGFEQIIADDTGHNHLAVIIPRINDILLGSTAQINNWNTEIDPKDTEAILRKCANINPLFEKVEIIEESVGLRPARDEIRLEPEMFGDKMIVHNYGHGGAGFTLSWGCSQDIVDIIAKYKEKR